MIGLALLRGLVPGANDLKCMSQEDPGAHQTHQCCYRVDHFSGPLHPRATQPNDVEPYTVKKISLPKPRSDTTDVFVQQVCQSGNARTHPGKDWLTTQGASPFPPRSACDIVTRWPHGWAVSGAPPGLARRRRRG